MVTLLSILMKCQTVSQSGHIISHTINVWGFQFSYILDNISYWFFYYNHSSVCEWYLIVALICISLMANMSIFSCDYWHLSSLEKCLAIFFAHFFFKILFIYLTEGQPGRGGTQAGWVGEEEQAPSGGAWCRARSQNTEIMPWAEGRRLTTAPPRRPYPY